MDRRSSVGCSRSSWITAGAIGCLVASGCDPILNIQGSFFPSWIVCMAVGGILTGVLRQLFVLLRLEPNLGPLLLVYPSTWLLVTMLTWLVLYRA
ncbi:MAG TPA: YtcA family lipoprotein [Candidatus Methylomirabilis sp.]|nr:YtcA family lipoprotein [Candidatus Methylomirabilis sp.]